MLKLVMLAGLMLLIVIATRHRRRDGDAATGLFPPAQ
jgi:hypothetical protein